MMRYIPLILLAGCSTAATPELTQGRWCEGEFITVSDAQPTSEYQVQFVSKKKHDEAANKLRKRLIVKLNSREVRTYFPEGHDPAFNYYIARSGAKTGVVDDIDQLHRELSSVSITVWHSASSDTLFLSSMQIGRGGNMDYSVPVTIKSKRTTRNVVTRCFRGS